MRRAGTAVSAVEEAHHNNERPETHAWARKLLEVIDGEPMYDHCDELYQNGLKLRSPHLCWRVASRQWDARSAGVRARGISTGRARGASPCFV